MTYLGPRRALDADSHLMEMPGFLDPFIETAMRDRLRDPGMAGLTPVLRHATEAAERRATDAEARSAAEQRLLLDKGWAAMGAFDPTERSRVVDLLGVEGQLVFATFATAQFMGRDVDLLYAGSAAHNRAVAAFCADDLRLLPVSFIPLVDTGRAVALLEEAIEVGCAAVHVPSTAAGDRSPTHPDLDPFWAALEASGRPFVHHVGGGGRLLDRAFHDNGRPVTDHLGGGENIRSKDFLAINHSPSLFLGAMILDGMFDRFPALRGGVIEEGAAWVVSWLRQLDFAHRAFRRTEEPLRQLTRTPSEYVPGRLWFTPFPGEPVGWMIDQAGPELFLFSTDYPHPEGGRDPLAKFEQAMTDVAEADRDRFFYGNLAALLGPERVPATTGPDA